MASPPTAGQPNLVSFVLQSKKALLHGEQLCKRAHNLQNASAGIAIDALELGARVRWFTDAVLAQLALASDVMRTIQSKRVEMEQMVESFDIQRTERNNALDTILDSLGAQTVPPDFYVDSSAQEEGIFVSPDDSEQLDGSSGSPRTVRHAAPQERRKELATDRRIWRTLRDFVDERAIEQVLEIIETGRNGLDRVLDSTADYPDIIDAAVQAIKRTLPSKPLSASATPVATMRIPVSLPTSPRRRSHRSDSLRSTQTNGVGPPASNVLNQSTRHIASSMHPSSTGLNPARSGIASLQKSNGHVFPSRTQAIEEVVEESSMFPLENVTQVVANQEKRALQMAHHLNSLTAHYDAMAHAEKDYESGVVFGEDEISEMHRDTDELVSIVDELEASCAEVSQGHDQLRVYKSSAQRQLTTHSAILDDLDNLAEIMTDMLSRVEEVEEEVASNTSSLHEHLLTLEDLRLRFKSYQFSYNKLLLEMARRRQYRDAAERIVQGMVSQLSEMVSEEQSLRASFNTEHGVNLPTDLCLSIENPPTGWKIIPINSNHFGGTTIEASLLAQVTSQDFVPALVSGPHATEGSGSASSMQANVERKDDADALPDVPDDLLNDARERLANTDGDMEGDSAGYDSL